MKIALITDTHFGARGDSLVFHNYFMKFYDKVFFPYLEKNNISNIIHLGDVTDRRKFINYNTLDGLRTSFIDRLKKYNTHFIVGNHDVYYKNTNRINSMDQLFGGGFNVWTETATISIGGTDICLVPWINSENQKQTVKHIKKTKAKIALGHLELNGFEMIRGIKCESGMDIGIFKKFDLTCSGHFHTKSSQGNIHYLGSPYEFFWNDCDDSKGFHILDTDKIGEVGELDFIANPFNIFKKIWYDDSPDASMAPLVDINDMYIKVIVKNKTDQYRFDSYIDDLYKLGVADLSIVDEDDDFDYEELDKPDQAEDTLALLSKYIDNYEVDIDKNELKTIMNELYISALRGD